MIDYEGRTQKREDVAHKQGIEQGREEGRELEKKKIAKKLIYVGFNLTTYFKKRKAMRRYPLQRDKNAEKFEYFIPQKIPQPIFQTLCRTKKFRKVSFP